MSIVYLWHVVIRVGQVLCGVYVAAVLFYAHVMWPCDVQMLSCFFFLPSLYPFLSLLCIETIKTYSTT